MSVLRDLPVIVTPRLRVEALRREDANSLRRLTDDAVILSAIHFLPDPFGLADAEALITGAGDGRDVFFGGRLLVEDHLVIVCGVHLLGEDCFEIGYWVGAGHRGAGFAFEAVQALITALRRHVPRLQLVAECRRENQASWRLLHKLGFETKGEPGKRPGRTRLVAGSAGSGA